MRYRESKEYWPVLTRPSMAEFNPPGDSEAKDELAVNGTDSTPANTARFPSASVFAQPAAIGLACDDAEDIVNVVAKFVADTKQGGPIFGTENDVIALRLAAKDGDLEHQESYLSVTASTKALDNEMQTDLDPA